MVEKGQKIAGNRKAWLEAAGNHLKMDVNDLKWMDMAENSLEYLERKRHVKKSDTAALA